MKYRLQFLKTFCLVLHDLNYDENKISKNVFDKSSVQL